MSPLEIARTRIFAPVGLDDAAVSQALGVLAATGADIADLYFESTKMRRWRIEDGRIAGGSFAIEQGVGVRAVHGGEVAFSHTADLRIPSVMEAVGTVRSLRQQGDKKRRPPSISLTGDNFRHGLYPAIDAVATGDADAWIALLDRVDRIARSVDPRVRRVDASVLGIDQVILIADIDGRMAADVRPTIRLSITVVAEATDRRARGHAALGVRSALDGLDEAAIERAVRKAVRIAIVNLDSRPAPAGAMPVVLGPGYPGVLFHEAVGHGLEGDHHRKHLSVFTGRLGDRIAAPGVTVIDDGGIQGRIGSVGIDDEGTAAERTVLVENGILVGLMQDRLNGRLMNAPSTGNCRRQSYAHLPMPRMTNTFLEGGTEDPADIIASVKHGIYATEFGGGQVDIATGRFNFTTTEAYLIEDGRVTAPIDGATLIGLGHEALRHVSMVGHDMSLDDGQATCGKQGQTLDVSVGQPTIRIDEMMVGGRDR